jgi:hypothetical protein
MTHTIFRVQNSVQTQAVSSAAKGSITIRVTILSAPPYFRISAMIHFFFLSSAVIYGLKSSVPGMIQSIRLHIFARCSAVILFSPFFPSIAGVQRSPLR